VDCNFPIWKFKTRVKQEEELWIMQNNCKKGLNNIPLLNDQQRHAFLKIQQSMVEMDMKYIFCEWVAGSGKTRFGLALLSVR
jgi:hypothetical protein